MVLDNSSSFVITLNHYLNPNILLIPNDLQIYNDKERGDPAQDAELDEVVFDEGLGRGAAEAEDNHVLQIAEHACQHPTARQIDIAGAHSLDDFWRHGVHDVTDEGDAGNDGGGLVDEGLVVTSDGDSRFLARLLIDAIVVIALGESQKKRH